LANLSVALERLGRVEEARDRLRQALELDPARSVWREHLADLLARSGDWEGGMQQVSVGLQFDPDNVRLARLRQYLRQASAQGFKYWAGGPSPTPRIVGRVP
jgi:protein involved in temperature-dependent protein secretion